MQNLVTNNGFEFGNNEDAFNWTETLEHWRTPENTQSGNYSIKSNYTNNPGEPGVSTVSNPITLDPDTAYTLSGYIYRTSNIQGSAYLDLNDADFECHASSTPGFDGWAQVSCDFTTPSDVNDVRVRLVTDNGISGVIYFDDITLGDKYYVHYSTFTSDGTYNLSGLHTGTYEISVMPLNPNLMEQIDSVKVVAGETKIVNFTFQPAGSIAGRVTDVNGTPITNVYMFLSGFETPRYSVDENGNYIIPGLYAGTYTVNTDAYETEFLDDSKTVNVTVGETTFVNFTLPKGRKTLNISIYVFNSSNEPINNTYVFVTGYPSENQFYKNTDENGSVEFLNISHTFYEIAIYEYTIGDYTQAEISNYTPMLDATSDIQINFTLLKIDVTLKTNSSEYYNGDIIKVNLTVENNDIYDIENWEVGVELYYVEWGWVDGDYYQDEEWIDKDYYLVNVTSGGKKSFLLYIQVPEDNKYSTLRLDNKYSDLYLEGWIQTDEIEFKASKGLLQGKLWKEEWKEITIMGTCYCSNCDECNAKLNDPSCIMVKLNNSITNYTETCIDNPENFTNKIFDCQEHTIDGMGGGYGIYLNSKTNNIIRGCIITDFEYGIYLNSSSNNTLQGNKISNNNIGIYSQNSNSTINSNIVCKNSILDFNSSDWQSSYGANNACDTGDWNDEGINNCWYICNGLPRICDLNHNGMIVNDWNDLMTTYKCFLGINKNCNNYQNWNLIKQEYQCFIKNDI